MTTAKKKKKADVAPADATNDAPKAPRKARVDVSEVLLSLLSGAASVKKLHADKKVSRTTFRKASDALRKNDLLEQARALDEIASEFYPRGSRLHPTDGTRRYAVQRLKDQDSPWIRVPLRGWKVDKGDHVKVTFENEKIVISVA